MRIYNVEYKHDPMVGVETNHKTEYVSADDISGVIEYLNSSNVYSGIFILKIEYIGTLSNVGGL